MLRHRYTSRQREVRAQPAHPLDEAVRPQDRTDRQQLVHIRIRVPAENRRLTSDYLQQDHTSRPRIDLRVLVSHRYQDLWCTVAMRAWVRLCWQVAAGVHLLIYVACNLVGALKDRSLLLLLLLSLVTVLTSNLSHQRELSGFFDRLGEAEVDQQALTGRTLKQEVTRLNIAM